MKNILSDRRNTKRQEHREKVLHEEKDEIVVLQRQFHHRLR